MLTTPFDNEFYDRIVFVYDNDLTNVDVLYFRKMDKCRLPKLRWSTTDK